MNIICISRESMCWDMFIKDFRTIHLYNNKIFNLNEIYSKIMAYRQKNDVANNNISSTKEERLIYMYLYTSVLDYQSALLMS